VLTVVDTTGIQEYIFNSNKLQHSIGASYLVDWATHGAVYESLRQLEEGSATNVDGNGAIDAAKEVGVNGVTSELIYAGGGNAAMLFRDSPLAHQFARTLTRRVLDKAPGLNLVLVHYELASEPLAIAVQQALKQLARKKLNRRHATPLLGLGVTAACNYTGLPAVAEDDGRLLSAEIEAKAKVIGDANRRLSDAVGTLLLGAQLDFIYDFDQLGSKGESSYMAVVHIDGNGMGRRVEGLVREYGKDDDAYIHAMRSFAASVHSVADRALQESVRLLQIAIERDGDDQKRGDGKERIGGVVPVNDDRLPFRPIVFGGDDITFVCDGRLGLTLAEFYLRMLEQELWYGGKLYARAGVAVVKSHYPFARAYELAEELAGSAKQFIREQPAVSEEHGYSAMDWHFGVNGLVLGLNALRARDYQHPTSGALHMRPLLAGSAEAPGVWRTWSTFEAIIDGFCDENGEWVQNRSKLKRLRRALRDGPDATEQFLRVATPGRRLYEVPGMPDTAETGWIDGDRSTSFDAVEALDFYVPLARATAPGGV